MNTNLDLASFPLHLRQEIQDWDTIEPIAADGSSRRFFRLKGSGGSCICLYHPHPPGEQVTENDSYYRIGRHLHGQGVPVPEIFTYCREEGWFLVEDLGDRSLQEEYLQAEGQARLAIYRQALKVLVDLQTFGTQGFSPEWCFDTEFYDANLVRQRECHYFVKAFVQGYLGLATSLEDFAADFDLLLERALFPEQRFFLHRDFQSRNLMVHRNRLWLIDFQGARLGPRQYDLAALLLDPYVNMPPATQEILLTEYLELLRDQLPVDLVDWRRQYKYVALCRNMQILGAYGFLSQQKGKTFFQQFIPPACRSLQNRLEGIPAGELPRLKRVVRQAAALIGSGH
jgi:aminoglycoside/choline kinase family phosphotransferase